jgi:hypothetical protein
MSWNGTGTWSAPSLPGSLNPAITGQQATPADWNTFLAALSGAQGISNLICKDGQTVPTANLPMGGFRHSGVGNPDAINQYGTVSDLINTGYIYGTDIGAADVYQITLPVALATYAVGQIFRALVANTNLTNSPTFQVTGLSAGAIANASIGALSAGTIASVAVTSLVGTTPTFQLLNVGPTTGMRMGFTGKTSSVPSGWVMSRGNTIGDASSNATERANADTQALFTLWYNDGNDTTHPIKTSGGAATTRAAQGTAAAAFGVHCQLTMPNYTDRFAMGMGGVSTTPGQTGGASSVTLAVANLPPHQHNSPGSVSGFNFNVGGGGLPNYDATGPTSNGSEHGLASTPFSIVPQYVSEPQIVKL